MPHIPRHNSFRALWKLGDITPCVVHLTFPRFSLQSRETQFKPPKPLNSWVQPCSRDIHHANPRLQRQGSAGSRHYTEPETCRRSWESHKHSGCYSLAKVWFPIPCLCLMEQNHSRNPPQIKLFIEAPGSGRGGLGNCLTFYAKLGFLALWSLQFSARRSLSFTFFGFLEISFWIKSKGMQSASSPAAPGALQALGMAAHEIPREQGWEALPFPNPPEKCRLFVHRWCCMSLEKELLFPWLCGPQPCAFLSGAGPALGLCWHLPFQVSAFKDSKKFW